MNPTQSAVLALRQQLTRTIVGQTALLDRLVIGLLCGGHVLVEGLPGLAKTTAVKTLARAVHAPFRRIQFTPDLLPSDLIGSEILDMASQQFRFLPGPLFHDIILADEINRAPAKVQAALLEAMQEKNITVAGQTRPLPPLFMVMATQNPLEQAGTYPLPQAQLDRFLLHVRLDYPSQEEEVEILRRDRAGVFRQDDDLPGISIEQVLQARREVQAVYLSPVIEEYIVQLVRATREPGRIEPAWGQAVLCGASPRASLSLSHAAAAWAYLQGRDHVVPHDVQAMAPDVLRHRMELRAPSRQPALDADTLIRGLIEHLAAP